MKKIILLVLPIALLLGGCTNSKETAKKDNNKTEVIKKNNENKKKYNQIVKEAKKDGEEQNKDIASVSHSYIKMGQADIVGEYSSKVSDFNEKSNKSIVVKGVITKWEKAPRYNGQVMTYLIFHVKNQYNFKSNTNLEGQNILFYSKGGYTTNGEQNDNMPDKSFAPKPKLTDTEKKETTFIDSVDIPLPRVGSQVIMAISPIDVDGSYKDGKKFDENTQFNKNEKFSLTSGIYSIFTLNTKTNKYESLSLNNDGNLIARKPYNKSVADGRETVDQTPKRLQELLDDINQNYR